MPFHTTRDPELELSASMRLRRFSAIANKDRTLQLAATASLSKRIQSPLSKLRETRGLVTLKTVPDNFDVKRTLCKKEYPNSGFKYE
jgi:hypothetical protein